jgi:quinoprotein glucose dehydrogenase
MRVKSAAGLAIVLLALSARGSLLRGAAPTGARGDWTNAVGEGARRYSPLDQITAANVQNLAVVWRWETADRALQSSNPVLVTARNEEMPLMVDGTLYTITGLGLIAALDPATGQARWVYDPESYKAGRPNNVGFVQRGLAYWTDGKIKRLFAGTADAYLLSVDPQTGRPDPAFGTAGKVDLTVDIAGATRAINLTARRPLVAGNVVVMGSSIADGPGTQQMPAGDVQAYDARTGKKIWTFHTVPKRGEFGYDTWFQESAEVNGSANVWGGMTYDPDLDYVFFATSSADNNWFGGRRPGPNLFSDSLVCVEAKTGRRVWHFQAVHHDIWDYDFPTPPILGQVKMGGATVDAVIQVSKQAFTYAFERKTGRPLWPIEERPVPKGITDGEWYSPTQPFPTKPAPFDLQGTTEENLIDFTPELKAQALERLRRFDHGVLFTPVTAKGSLVLPGWQGGANWGGAAFDTETGMLYVPSVMNPSVRRPAGAGGQPDPALLAIDGLPIFKPPYTRITAIDMNTGDHRWMAAVGNGPRAHPLLKDVPAKTPLGDAVDRASALVTKTVLIVGVSRLGLNGLPQRPAWAKWGDPDADRKLLYVYDKKSGALVREIQFDGFSAGAPMTYLHAGRQYVVVAVGGRERSELVALALPQSSQN